MNDSTNFVDRLDEKKVHVKAQLNHLVDDLFDFMKYQVNCAYLDGFRIGSSSVSSSSTTDLQVSVFPNGTLPFEYSNGNETNVNIKSEDTLFDTQLSSEEVNGILLNLNLETLDFPVNPTNQLNEFDVSSVMWDEEASLERFGLKYQFGGELQLDEEEKMEEEVKVPQNPQDSQDLQNPQNAQNLLNSHNPKNSQKSQKKSRTTPFRKLTTCDYPECNKQFSTRDLARHKLTHSTHKSFTCPWPGCDRAFTTNGYLLRHTRTHTQVRPHLCDWPGCFAAFLERQNLLRHQLIHTGERPHACEVGGCGAAFTQKSTLNRHRKAVHSEILVLNGPI